MPQVHVILDLDDTLYPERDYAIGGFAAAGAWALDRYGVIGLAGRLTTLLDQGHLGASFKIAITEAVPDHSEADLKALHRAYAEHTPQIALFEDAERALAALSGVSKGLITDGHAKTQERKVKALGIAGQFSKIIYTGALGADRAFHKPHPRAFEEMEASLRTSDGDRFVYVGDNPAKDFLAPNVMGWQTVMIDRPHTRSTRIHPLTPPPPGGAAHLTIASLCDLGGVVDYGVTVRLRPA